MFDGAEARRALRGSSGATDAKLAERLCRVESVDPSCGRRDIHLDDISDVKLRETRSTAASAADRT
jgi:hypothetical protein